MAKSLFSAIGSTDLLYIAFLDKVAQAPAGQQNRSEQQFSALQSKTRCIPELLMSSFCHF